MAQRPRKSLFGGRGIAQAGGRPWRSKKLQDLVQRTLTIRGRYTEVEVLRAVTSAPTTWAAVPTASSPPSVSYGAAGNDTPDTTKLGGVSWKRYWFRGANGQPENTGGGRTLLQRADFHPVRTQGPALGGGVNYNNNSGNSTEWWQGYQSLLRANQDPNDVGDFSNWGWGFTLTGRGFAFTGQNFTDFVVYVEEGGVLKRTPLRSFPISDIYAYVDFGTSATRNILLVIEPDSWSSEVLIPTTATMVPWSGWRTNKLTCSFLTDSYFQSINDTDGAALIEQVSLLVGGHAVPHASAQGGSGYSSDNQDANVRPFQFPHRLNRFSTPQPDLGFIFGGINDGWPTSNIAGGGTSNTAQAIDRTLQTVRFDNPSMLLVVGSPWSPNGPNGQTVGGKYQLLNNYLQTALAKLPGPWIFIDSLSGSWKTSKGTQRSTAEGPWITGTGNSGAPNGTGNADTYIGPDGTHPNDAGRRYLSEKISQYTHEAAASMLPAATINGGAFDLDIFDPDYFEGAYTQLLAGVSQTAALSGAAAPLSVAASQTLGGVVQSATISAPAGATAAQTLAGVTQSAVSAAPAGVSAAQTLAGASQAATLTAPVAFAGVQGLAGVAQSAAVAAVDRLSATQASAGVIQAATVAATPAVSAAQTLAGVTQTSTLGTVPLAISAAQTVAGVGQASTAGAAASVASTQALAGVAQAAQAAARPGASAVQTAAGVSQVAASQAIAATAGAQTLAGVAQAAAASVSDALGISAAQTAAGVAQSAMTSAPAVVNAVQTAAPVGQAASAASRPAVSGSQVLSGVGQVASAAIVPSGAYAAQTTQGVAQSSAATARVSAAASQQVGAVVSAATAAVLARLNAAQGLSGVSQSVSVGQLRVLQAAQQLAAIGQVATMARPALGLQAAQTVSFSQAAQLERLTGATAFQTLANAIQLAALSHNYLFEPSERTYFVAAERRGLVVHGEDRHWRGVTPERRVRVVTAEDRNY